MWVRGIKAEGSEGEDVWRLRVRSFNFMLFAGLILGEALEEEKYG